MEEWNPWHKEDGTVGLPLSPRVAAAPDVLTALTWVQPPEDIVERSVLEHENDDVLDPSHLFPRLTSNAMRDWRAAKALPSMPA